MMYFVWHPYICTSHLTELMIATCQNTMTDVKPGDSLDLIQASCIAHAPREMNTLASFCLESILADKTTGTSQSVQSSGIPRLHEPESFFSWMSCQVTALALGHWRSLVK